MVSPETGGATRTAGEGAEVAGGKVGPPRDAPSMGGSGVDAQPASIPKSVPTMASHAKVRPMLVILLEALLAMGLLIFIVWWTMFSGRKGGEPGREEEKKD